MCCSSEEFYRRGFRMKFRDPGRNENLIERRQIRKPRELDYVLYSSEGSIICSAIVMSESSRTALKKQDRRPV